MDDKEFIRNALELNVKLAKENQALKSENDHLKEKLESNKCYITKLGRNLNIAESLLDQLTSRSSLKGTK